MAAIFPIAASAKGLFTSPCKAPVRAVRRVRQRSSTVSRDCSSITSPKSPKSGPPEHQPNWGASPMQYHDRQLASEALDQIFNEARSYNGWLDKEVTVKHIEAINDLMKMGTTSAKMQTE